MDGGFYGLSWEDPDTADDRLAGTESRPGYRYPPIPPTLLTTSAQRVLCPDLLSIRDLGVADGWRGRVVRIFFRVLRTVTGL